MIISAATKSLCKRCNTDMKEKLACEINELITSSGLSLVSVMKRCAEYAHCNCIKHSKGEFEIILEILVSF